jgi:NADH:ubiquinone oxidoreductase subunit 4 (subunit M)
MLLLSLLVVPLIGIFVITTNLYNLFIDFRSYNYLKLIKFIALSASILNFIISLIIFIVFDFSYNQFQFVQEPYDIMGYNIYLGIDGISIYFILLTTIIMPIALLSN